MIMRSAFLWYLIYDANILSREKQQYKLIMHNTAVATEQCYYNEIFTTVNSACVPEQRSL